MTINLVAQLQAAASAPHAEPPLSGPLAVLFGIEPPPARDARVQVRTVRLLGERSHKTRHLPLPVGMTPQEHTCHEQRKRILSMISDAGEEGLRAKDIMARTRWTEYLVGRRLMELKAAGVIEDVRGTGGRPTTWFAVEEDGE